MGEVERHDLGQDEGRKSRRVTLSQREREKLYAHNPEELHGTENHRE
jgi:hypothetical protein